jgi:RNA polymerase sigma-70 factor (ECF subfamily)
MNPTLENQLIVEAQEGDGEAFSTLVRPYLGLFYAGIHRILLDISDAQDALQEALISIHSELARFQGKSKFSTWAYRICINEALMLRRSRIRRREDAIEDFLPRFSPEGHLMNTDRMRDWSQDAMALASVERDQLRTRIREGLQRLSDDQRAVFILRDLEGMNTDEVAIKLGISRGLVRQRLHRARLGLRGFLDAFMTGRRK